MKKYVRAEMEIDKFEENSGVIMANSCPCDVCPNNWAYGEGEDPWGGDPWD